MSLTKEQLDQCEQWLQEVQDHLRDELLPFWMGQGLDSKYGGYLTYFDGDGNPTGESQKTLVAQAQMVSMYSKIERAGLVADGRATEHAQHGVDFLLEHCWDSVHGGWYWIVDQQGEVVVDDKHLLAQAVALSALSEFGMISGDYRGMERASETFQTIQTFAADNRHGGYYECFDRTWNRKLGEGSDCSPKAFDGHLHLLDALNTMFEATGLALYRERCREVIDVLFERMLTQNEGVAILETSGDWRPADTFSVSELRDWAEVTSGPGFCPASMTSYADNLECAWLTRHALNICDIDSTPYQEALRKMCAHSVRYGMDTHGGLCSEGPLEGPPSDRKRGYWQQAEALTGLLDAYLVHRDTQFIEAYGSVHRLVFDRLIEHEIGEWYPEIGADNQLVDSYLGDAWKTGFHSVRSMIEVESRLHKILRNG